MQAPLQAHVTSATPPEPTIPAPTAGEPRKEYSENLLSRFSKIFAQTSNPISMWILPGGAGKYLYDANTIQTGSNLQFQNNPILHASIAQMMIEINNIDKTLGKTTTIADNAQAISATVTEQTAARIQALAVPEALKAQPGIGELAATIANKVATDGVPDGAIGGILSEAKKQGVLTASIEGRQDNSVGVGFEQERQGFKAGFEKESQEKGGTLKFKGNCKDLPQPQLTHDLPDPMIRAFSFLAEMLVLLLMNAANIRTEVTFNAVAQMYQQRIQELVQANPVQAAEYLNKVLFTKDALDPSIQQALQRALGLEGIASIEAAKLSIDPAKGLCYNGELCKGATAAHISDLARKEHFKAGGEGPVEFRLVGSEEQLDAVKKMNTHSAPKLETGMELSQTRASITQAPSAIQQNQPTPVRMNQ